MTNIQPMPKTIKPQKKSLEISAAQKWVVTHESKHGSWLNIAEIELSVLKRQCLAGRIDCIEKMREEVSAWNSDRNNRQTQVDWQFTASDARVKLKRLYPKL